jgi:hypothetical protein
MGVFSAGFVEKYRRGCGENETTDVIFALCCFAAAAGPGGTGGKTGGADL